MPKSILKLTVVLSLYCIIQLIFRVFYTNSFFYIFLLWNLILAYIPFWISHRFLTQQKIRKIKILFWSILLIWMAFLPNAPYIITDLFHLQKGSSMPQWFDLILVCSFACNGLLLFYISIMEVNQILKQQFSKITIAIATSFIFLLCGFGIYLGRYLRWNSWDIVQNPAMLFRDAMNRFLHPMDHPKTWGVTIGFGVFSLFWILRDNYFNFNFKSNNKSK